MPPVCSRPGLPHDEDFAAHLDETEFLSRYGVRAFSRAYLDHPYDFEYNGVHYRVKYEAAESDTGLFGGNSNWRGPIWMPVNYLLIEKLRRFHRFYGDGRKIECPTGSGIMLTLDQIADELCGSLIKLFLRDAGGRRPVFGRYDKFQTDPHFRDYILFHEYFDGDKGRGCGASHQTGWTGLVANLIGQLAQRTTATVRPSAAPPLRLRRFSDGELGSDPARASRRDHGVEEQDGDCHRGQ